MAARAWLTATVLAACSAAALADGNLTASGYDVDGNMFKEAGLTRKFDPKDKGYIMHLIWIAMPGTREVYEIVGSEQGLSECGTHGRARPTSRAGVLTAPPPELLASLCRHWQPSRTRTRTPHPHARTRHSV